MGRLTWVVSYGLLGLGSIGCSQAPCEDGFGRASDGNCYPIDTTTTTLPHYSSTTLTDSTPSGCEGIAPEITDIVAENGGMYSTTDGKIPSLLFAIQMYDSDGDLTEVGYEVWYDTDVDGVTDTEGAPESSGGTTVDTADCMADDVTLNLTMGVDGGDLDFDTEYDFGMVIYDAAGYASEAAFVTTWTPTSKGKDGGSKKK